MKRLEKAFSVLPLLAVLGCASTQPTADRTASGVFEIPDRGKPFVSQAETTTGLAEASRPAPSDRRFEIPQRGIPFAEERKPIPEPENTAKASSGRVYSPDAHILPTRGLPAVPRIVAAESTLGLPGFGSTPEEREMFRRERVKRIEARLTSFDQLSKGIVNDHKAILGCFVIFCPLVMPAVAGIAWAGEQTVGRAVVSAREPSLIPEADSLRLASLFRERAIGSSLQERLARFAGAGYPSSADGEGIPRLTVRITAVRLYYHRQDMGISVVAQAQASASPGDGWPSTQHVYESPLRRLAAWTADNDRQVLQEMDSALEALARDIWQTYSPKQANSATARVPADGALKSGKQERSNDEHRK